MASASQGYISDTSYANKLHKELSPAWLNYAAVLNRTAPVNLRKPFTYLELGCGSGRSSISNAAQFTEGRFHACDFNPAHIEQAALARRRRNISNLALHQKTFQALLEEDLPDFDFIVAHGVYSWVNKDVQQSICTIIQRKLKPGGLLYIGYNCLPGWSAEIPIRRLIVEMAETQQGTSSRRMASVLDRLGTLSRAGLGYLQSNPRLEMALESYRRGPLNYIAHEFLNEAWEPFYSVDLAARMHDLGLDYAGSATLVDNHPILLVSPKQADAINTLPTPRLRHLAMDFALNRSFRRDIFSRTGNKLSEIESNRLLGGVLVRRRADISKTVNSPRGAFTFGAQFIDALSTCLDPVERPLVEIVKDLANIDGDTTRIGRNLLFLIAMGGLIPRLL